MPISLTSSVRPASAGWKALLCASATGWLLASTVACDSRPEDSAADALERSTQAVLVGSRIQAETWSTAGTTPGAVFNEAGGDGQSVAGFQVNEQIQWASVNFGNGADQIQFRLGAPYGGGKAEIWLDAVGSGTKIGTVALTAATGSDWNAFITVPVSVTRTSGTHSLYLKGIATGGDWLFKIDWFELYDTGSTTTPPPPSGTVPVVVTNKCPFSLNVALTGVGNVSLEKDASGNTLYRALGTGQSYTYNTPSVYPSGRVSAYKVLPTPTSPRELEKAEFTLDFPSGGSQMLYYNLTYVDHMGLPMQITGTGSGSGCVQVQCNKTQSAFQSAIDTSCPDGLRYSMGGGTICLAPRSFCIDGEYSSDSRRPTVCTRLDSEIARCASLYPGVCNPGTAKTPQVYACTAPFFDQSAKWCAALNRGMVDAPDSTNVASYYNTGKPYNLYASFVHQQCGAVYAFPYDDYPMAANQAGFFSCSGGTKLSVTFCPAG